MVEASRLSETEDKVDDAQDTAMPSMREGGATLAKRRPHRELEME